MNESIANDQFITQHDEEFRIEENKFWHNIFSSERIVSKNYHLDECYVFYEYENKYSDDDNSDFDENEISVNEDEICEKMNTDQKNNFVDQNNSKENKHENSIEFISNSLRSIFARWGVQCSIPHNSIRKLLHSIRDEIAVLSLPLDPRTLLKTPKNTVISKIEGGFYCHFTLSSCIEKIILKRLQSNIDNINIDLLINIDGAPLGASSEKSLWPILCSEKSVKNVYIVGVYCGSLKPNDPNEFLKPFVEETINLVQHGFMFNEIMYNVNIYGLIFDAPAKAFILNVKYHSGYDCCSKCDIEGTMYKCVCFPGKIGNLRTDDGFRLNAYSGDYQKGETILNAVPNLGLVTCVPLDPMHLVYLGCMRKLLLIWLIATSVHKLPTLKQDELSNKLLSFKEYIPCDFNRKPRHLKYIKFFKATELRQILLYLGVIAFKNIVSPDVYLNFITLHVAISILNSPVNCKDAAYLEYAEKLLQKFVEHFENIYGAAYVSYNFHNLSHLANDSRKYGELENFSAFQFENFIGYIKKLIRKGQQPLQQLMRRCAEIEIVENKIYENIDKKDLKLVQQHRQGPVMNEFINCSQYKVIKFDTFKIYCPNNKDNCIQINNKLVVNALNFIKKGNGKIFVIGKQMRTIGSIYDIPIPSTCLGINVVDNNPTNEYESWNIDQISAKLVKLPYGNQIVTFPLAHTYRNTN